MIGIVSLPHTGNNFVQEFLWYVGIKDADIEISHCDPWGMYAMIGTKYERIVIPRRHPKLVLASLMNRGGYTQKEALQYVKDCIPCLFSVAALYPNKFDLAIDAPDLSDQLHKLAGWLGREYDGGFDMRPRNSVPGDYVASQQDIVAMATLMNHWGYR